MLHYLNSQLVSEQVHLLWFDYLSAILDPFVLVAAMKKVIPNCGLSVCDNDSMSMIEGCPNNEILELLKKKETC